MRTKTNNYLIPIWDQKTNPFQVSDYEPQKGDDQVTSNLGSDSEPESRLALRSQNRARIPNPNQVLFSDLRFESGKRSPYWIWAMTLHASIRPTLL